MCRAIPATYAFAGTTMTVLVPDRDTAGAFALLHVTKPPGSSTPLHRHERDAEVVYVLSGQAGAETEDGTQVVPAGQTVVLPPGRPHRLFNDAADTARELLLCVPAGFEDVVAEAGTPAEPFAAPVAMTDADRKRLAATACRHGIKFLRVMPTGASAPRPVATTLAARDLPVLRIEAIAQLGTSEDSFLLLRITLTAGATAMLDGDDAPAAIFAAHGRVAVRTRGKTTGWDVLWHDEAARGPGAMRNAGEADATVLLVATLRAARLLTPGSPETRP